MAQNIPSQPASQQQQRQVANYTNSTSLKDIFYICLAHWKWFALCLLVCLACAKIYILKTPKTYTRVMSVLLKEDKNGQTIGTDAAQVFGDMGITSTHTNV